MSSLTVTSPLPSQSPTHELSKDTTVVTGLRPMAPFVRPTNSGVQGSTGVPLHVYGGTEENAKLVTAETYLPPATTGCTRVRPALKRFRVIEVLGDAEV